MKLDLKKLHKLEDDAIVQVRMMLCEGNIIGGQSLVSLIEAFKEHGPYSAQGDRVKLAQHLARCLEAVIDMNATILARARVNPGRKPSKRAMKKAGA